MINKQNEETKVLDQAMNNNQQEQINSIKAEVYDLNTTIKNQNQIILVMCQELGVDLNNGFEMQAVVDKIRQLVSNQVEIIEEAE